MSARMEGNATRQSTPEERERLVGLLRRHELGKLEENVHKGHWENEDPLWLIERVFDEVAELKRALMEHLFEERPVEDVLRECADVRNFAAMIADVVTK